MSAAAQASRQEKARVLGSALIVADRSIYQLDQVLIILGSDAPELAALLKQVRDGFDHFRNSARDYVAAVLETQSQPESKDR